MSRYDIQSQDGKFDLETSHSADGATVLRLVLKEKLDREIDSSYDLVIYVVDGGQPPLTGSVTVKILVDDANDNRPEFDSPQYEASIREDAPVGSVLIRVKATDADDGTNGHVTYEFSERTFEEYSEIFTMDSLTGEIILKDHLDFEATSVFMLTVLAYDGGADSFPVSTPVVIRVVDVNDNPPVIDVNFMTSSGHGEVAENAPVGTFVCHVSVTDADSGDNGQFRCEIEAGLNPGVTSEKIYANQYKIVTSVSFDREEHDSVEFDFVCRDHGDPPLSSTKTIRLSIQDVNDHSPRFKQSSYKALLTENNEPGAFITTVEAEDGDAGSNSVIIYSLDPKVEHLLDIDPNSGSIRAAAIFDREATKDLTFHVFAADQGSPVARTSSVLVSLDVVDLNDERPQFDTETYIFAVSENLPSGTEVGSVVARDSDSNPQFNLFSYWINSESAEAKFFHVNSITGKITTRQILDREVG